MILDLDSILNWFYETWPSVDWEMVVLLVVGIYAVVHTVWEDGK